MNKGVGAIRRPFYLYRDDEGTLLFPFRTGSYRKAYEWIVETELPDPRGLRGERK
jgi:hypothetical protein